MVRLHYRLIKFGIFWNLADKIVTILKDSLIPRKFWMGLETSTSEGKLFKL